MNIRLFAPRYWPTWLMLIILRFVVFLPYPWQLKIGQFIGLAIKLFSKRLQRITRINLRLCFPYLSDIAHAKLMDESFMSLGIGLCETGLAWWASSTRLKSLLHIQGYHHLQMALKQGHGVLLLGAHFTTLEIVGRLLSPQLSFAVVYREQKNPVLAAINRYYLKRYYQIAIAKENMRGILKALKQNLPIWYTPDIDAGIKHSLFIPFFGIATATITATSRLAKLSKTSVIPVSFYRKDNAKGYELYFHPPWQNFPSDDIYADTVRINQFIEQAILKQPHQYLWQYKRFKTRPPGEARLYNAYKNKANKHKASSNS